MNIGVIFGSRSVEHDVSITSAYGIMMGLKKIGIHKIYPIYINREGKWIYDSKFMNIHSFKDYTDDTYKDVTFKIDFSTKKKLVFEQGKEGFFATKERISLDFIFPILHGMNGEDGSIQGVFDMLQVPYMGPGILGSATAMNKIIMKDIFTSLRLPITKYLFFKKGEPDTKKINTELTYPLIVKPANLGSSIGISKVKTAKDLDDAIAVAGYYDAHIIVEECVENLMELNCSVSEKDGLPITSLVEQPVGKTDFLSFEEKYISTDGGTMQGLKNKVRIPADIPHELTQKIQEYSKIIYSGMFCNGGAPRIDYLYNTVSKELFVNEINSVPGALQIHLWVKSGMKVEEFLTNLIDVGIEKAKARELNIDFKSNIIGHTIAFVK